MTIAQIIGILASAMYILSYQQKKRKNIILLNATSCVFYVLQYIMLGAFEGAMLDILSALSAFTASNKNKKINEIGLELYEKERKELNDTSYDNEFCTNCFDAEYLLEESYIKRVINEAEITDNSNNINLEELIKGKEAIVGNTKYYSENEKIELYYILDGKEEEMFIFYVDDLLVIQVGLSDEGPKFIAYK